MKTPRRSIFRTGATAALSLGFTVLLSAQAQAPYADPQRSGTDSSSATSTTRSGAAGMADAGQLSDDGRKFIEKAAGSGVKETRLAQLAMERTSNAEVRDYAQQLINDHASSNARLASIANVHGVMVPLHTASASMQMDPDSSSSSDAATSSTSSAGGATRASNTPSSSGGGAGVTGPSGGRVSDGDATTQRGTDYATDSSGSSTSARTTSSASAMEKADLSKAEKEAEAAVDKLAGKSGAEFDQAFVDMMIEDHQKAIEMYEEQAENEQDTMLSEYAESTLSTLRDHLETARSLRSQLGS